MNVCRVNPKRKQSDIGKVDNKYCKNNHKRPFSTRPTVDNPDQILSGHIACWLARGLPTSDMKSDTNELLFIMYVGTADGLLSHQNHKRDGWNILSKRTFGPAEEPLRNKMIPTQYVCDHIISFSICFFVCSSIKCAQIGAELVRKATLL